MKKLFILLAIFTTVAATAQSVGINADGSVANASAMLDVSSTTKGLLPPRMTTTQRDAITTPATGLVIFNTTTNGLEVRSSSGWSSLTTPSTTAVFLPTVVIGTQQWMRENLDVMTYRDGTVIPQVTDAATWSGLTTGAWCWYNNDPLNGAIYGKLYNWYAVNDPRGLAPQGWHIPSEAEWTNLFNLLGLYVDVVALGGKMKTTGTTRWTTPNTSATNESGFAGLPGGGRSNDGTFYEVGTHGNWWSATQEDSFDAWVHGLDYLGDLFGGDVTFILGYSVRCLRD